MMTGEIKIDVTSNDATLGPLLKKVHIIGVSFSYGINRIPVATLELDPASLSLFCDFDSIRRKSVTIIVNTPANCLRFDGVVDGCSVSQQPGSLTTALIVKHNFTFLNEG